MVPPTLRAHNMRPDHAAARPSGNLRDPNTRIPSIVNNNVMARMEYLRHDKLVFVVVVVRKQRESSLHSMMMMILCVRTTILRLISGTNPHKETLPSRLCIVIIPFFPAIKPVIDSKFSL